MLVYGGKNDNAFQYTATEQPAKIESSRPMNQVIYDQASNSNLDDIMIFNLVSHEWSTVAQRGWRPEARWSAGIAYHESMQQLFVFGGSGAKGSCRAEVYCCDLNLDRVNFRLSDLQNQIKDVEIASKKMHGQLVFEPAVKEEKKSQEDD